MTRDLAALKRITRRGLDRSLAVFEREIMAIYRAVFDETQAHLAKLYDRYATQGALTHAQMTKYNRMATLEKEINRIAGLGTQRSRAAIERLTRAQYQEAFFRNAWALEQHIGVTLSWGPLPSKAVVAAVENPLRLIAEDRLRTLGREKIRRAVSQGIVRGDSFARMSRELRGAIVAKDKESLAYNALRVARTEGGRAHTLGELLAYERAEEEEGIKIRKVWAATLDDRTRDSHAEMDGRVATEEGFWFPGIGYVEGPRLMADPAESIQCRCDIIPDMEELPPPVVRRIRDEGLQPYQTYEEWRPPA